MAIKKRRRKRRRRSGYITGIHKSDKCLNSPIKYRSSWELTVLRFLDSDNEVACYYYEPFKIPYISNIRSGKIRNYIPDFLVAYKNGKKLLIEVKRASALNQEKVIKKATAAREWASKQENTSYEFWTDSIIKTLQGIEKIREKCHKSNKKTKAKAELPY